MVRQQAHGFRAFRMGHYRHAGVFFLQGKNLVPRELHVHVAGPVPQFQGAAKLAAYPCTQILVRDEQDGAVIRSLGDDFTAFPEVTITSARALTPMEQFTYATT